MDYVEAAIASFVARRHPEAFAALETFCVRYNPLAKRDTAVALVRVEP